MFLFNDKFLPSPSMRMRRGVIQQHDYFSECTPGQDRDDKSPNLKSIYPLDPLSLTLKGIESFTYLTRVSHDELGELFTLFLAFLLAGIGLRLESSHLVLTSGLSGGGGRQARGGIEMEYWKTKTY